jgi:hypothetical protein
MAGTIVSTYTTYALTLSSGTKQNPVSISNTGTIDASQVYSAAIYGDAAAVWTIQNDGVLESNGYGISLSGGATITNGGAADTKATIYGYNSGIYAGKAATVANFATITGLITTGIVLEKGGTLTNGAAADTKALIYGGQYGVEMYGNSDLVTNFGTILGGTNGTGIEISGSSEAVVNGSATDKTALIYGYKNGFFGTGGSVDIDNFGSIIASTSYNSSGYGIYFSGGTITNHGLIAGLGGIIGLYAKGAGPMVVVNSGTIIGAGTMGNGIYMYLGTRGGTLVVDPGAVFEGNVVFAHGTKVSAVLELGSGASAGHLDGVGTGFESFTSIAFDAGGTWIVSGDSAGLAAGEVISGFGLGDEIILDDIAGTLKSYSSLTGLTIVSGAVTEVIDIVGSLAKAITVNHTGGETEIFLGTTAPCFCAGTRILTPLGDVAVETLRAGDVVITKDGEDAAVVWVGHRRVDVKRHPRPEAVRPVRFAAGVFGDGVPSRDLEVSPDHALFLDGCLVPAKALVNGANVRQMERDTVMYYHVELEKHDVIFAEGVAVETYLETGNRGDFENGGATVRLHPEFAQAMREGQSCAPFTETGPVVMRVRDRLAARATAGRWGRGVDDGLRPALRS